MNELLTLEFSQYSIVNRNWNGAFVANLSIFLHNFTSIALRFGEYDSCELFTVFLCDDVFSQLTDIAHAHSTDIDELFAHQHMQ